MRLVDTLPVESELDGLLAEGHSRTRATELVIEAAVSDATDAAVVVLVEGVSDRIAVEVLAARLGKSLRDEGTAIVPMGGATNIGRFVELFPGRELVGLYDAAQESHYARTFERAGLGRIRDRADLDRLGFFSCVEDLEDELIRSVGPNAVEDVFRDQGELASFRTMQNEPFHRGGVLERQVHRFIRCRSGRNYRYARLLVEALDLARVPEPLEQLLGRI